MKLALTIAFSLLLMAPTLYRRGINGNIDVYQNGIRQQTYRQSYQGYRQYDRYNRYQKTYYGNFWW